MIRLRNGVRQVICDASDCRSSVIAKDGPQSWVVKDASGEHKYTRRKHGYGMTHLCPTHQQLADEACGR